MDREPDWELFNRQIENGFENLDGVGIVELNAMRNGAVVEKKAKELFQRKHDIPVVCGYELFSELNCLQRGAGTLLNARLFPVIREFLTSVKKALSARDIHPAALVIVRSDGSLMSEEIASRRPVETLLCGPAASAIGCAQLADSPNGIVVDMGGTTTDIALIRDGMPVRVTGGVSIGKWKTFVNGLYIKTFGLGGDSAVHYAGKNLYLEEYRVTPLCVAAQRYPSVINNLRDLQKRKHTRFLYEHYMLVKDVGESLRYTDEEKAFCRALRDRPLPIAEAAHAVGKDVYTLQVSRLIRDGVVQICGFTPTDAMHIRGDFNQYNAEASRLCAEFSAHNLEISVEEFCSRIYDQVKRKLYINIVKAMLENKYPDYMKNGVHRDVARFIATNYEEIKNGRPDALLSTMFRTDYALIGVGAPICVFLEDVAKMLGAHAVIPRHHEVANALGAIIGSVSASCSVEIKANNTADGTSGYTVFGTDGNTIFEELEEAIAFAVSQASERAKSEAKKRGAKGEIAVTSEIRTDEAESRDGMIYLGTVVMAYAAGTMGF